MKKLLSLFGVIGLLAFIATPIYAQEDDLLLEDEEPIFAESETFGIIADEFNDVEDTVVEATEDVEDAVVGVIEDIQDVEDDYSDFDYDYAVPNSIDLVSPSGSSHLERFGRDRGTLAMVGGLGVIGLIIIYGIFVYMSLLPISQWEIYRKAGKKAWSFLVPFWGTMVYSEIAGMNKWLGLLPWLTTIFTYLEGVLPASAYSVFMTIITIATLIWFIIASYRIARRYEWGVLASVLHAIIIFMPITTLVLGLGDYHYQGTEKKEPETVVEV